MSPSSGRLVYVVEQFPAFSETFVQNELRELQRRGHEARVFALYPLRGDADPSARDMAHTVLPSSSRSAMSLVRAAFRVIVRYPVGFGKASALALARPSRLQAHCLAKACLLVADLDKRPRRYHAHFARASASTAMFAAAITGSRFSFTAHAIDIFWNPFDVDRKLERADATITVCQYNVDFIRTKWPGLGRVEIAPCGVDPAVFARSKPYRKDPIEILSVGRLVEKKGFHTLVEACAQLRDRGIDFRCRILGDGPERDRLGGLIAQNGLDDVVTLYGTASPAEVAAALEEASIFCLPCTIDRFGDSDSQPVVIKEAMAMEVPVVGTSVAAVPEMIDDEVGRLVPRDDATALASALEELASLPEAELAALGKRGRKRVQEHFSLEQQVMLLLQAWRSAER